MQCQPTSQSMPRNKRYSNRDWARRSQRELQLNQCFLCFEIFLLWYLPMMTLYDVKLMSKSKTIYSFRIWKLAQSLYHMQSNIKFGPLILLKIVSFTNFLVIIISPFAVQSAPFSLYNLTWYHVTFLCHHWDHWDNMSSPYSHLIEPCWHTVNSSIFGQDLWPKS